MSQKKLNRNFWADRHTIGGVVGSPDLGWYVKPTAPLGCRVTVSQQTLTLPGKPTLGSNPSTPSSYLNSL